MGNLSTQTYGKGELLIIGLNQATCIIDDTTLSNEIRSAIRFKNLTIDKTVAGTGVLFMRADNLATTQQVFENVTFTNTGGGVSETFIYRAGKRTFINCDGDDCGQGNMFSNHINGVIAAIGCQWYFNCPNNIACGDGATARIGEFPIYLAPFYGRVYAFNYYSSSSTGGAAFNFTNEDLGPRGICVVGNIFETHSGTAQAALQISADGDVTPNINMNVAMCTLVGGTGTTNPLASGRANLFYQDTGTVLVNKDGITRHNIYSTRNTKSDVFAANGALIGNWAMRHHVDCGYDFIDLGDSSGDTTPSPSSWLGEGLGDLKTEMGVSDVVTGNPDFTNDRSGSGTGNGDYSLGGLTDVPQIPAGETMFAVDLFGTAIPTDGTARAGAVQ